MSGWKASPGPWKLDTKYAGCKRITAKLGPQHRQAKRTELACTSGLNDEEEDTANGHAMAAVPDLVSALVGALACESEGLVPGDGWFHEMRQALRAAKVLP
jgi:hypothetical protein